MPGQGYNALGYNPKPYQGTIGGGNMSYNLVTSNKVTPYKGNINPNDRTFKPKEYKQTIDTKFKRKVPPPPKQPKQKPPKAAASRRAPNPNLKTAKVKGYEPNIKWTPGQQQIKPYEPKPYKGSIPSQPTPVKNYELPENYYGFPKGKRRPTPPRQPTPVKEQKIKRNKVQPLEPPPPRQVTPPKPYSGR
ncbi:basic salivary proline-rich protein 2-like [Physella acuta]|uniref:basic salivary proline-rich protein 2-like n=1 Tax=Physella acuta TaxID=109671 RepID=UPI0027DCA668|nr:basic salivary proline-rich protein 2-like [Physella acuta]